MSNLIEEIQSEIREQNMPLILHYQNERSNDVGCITIS